MVAMHTVMLEMLATCMDSVPAGKGKWLDTHIQELLNPFLSKYNYVLLQAGGRFGRGGRRGGRRRGRYGDEEDEGSMTLAEFEAHRRGGAAGKTCFLQAMMISIIMPVDILQPHS